MQALIKKPCACSELNRPDTALLHRILVRIRTTTYKVFGLACQRFHGQGHEVGPL
jgi:hypothetical protein